MTCKKSPFKLLLIFIFSLSFLNSLLAQNSNKRFVLVQGAGPSYFNGTDTSYAAFYGGFNFLQMASIDLNFDGFEDIIAIDRIENNLEVFVANGNVNNPKYFHAPYLNDYLPKLTRKIVAADFNGDGKKDLFTYSNAGGGIAVYKNTSNKHKLRFELYNKELSYYDFDFNWYFNVYSGNEDQSAIVDLDGDGDLDVLAFDNSGISIYEYKNLSVEKYGHRDSFNYILVADCWGKFDEYYGSNDTTRLDVTLNVACGTFKKSSGKHAGSNILAKDFDNDGDIDALISDSYYGNVVFLENGRIDNGKVQSKVDSFIAKSPDFPKDDIGVYLDNFPSINEIDIDLDGKLDLVIAPGNRARGNIVMQQCLAYKNFGSNQIPNYKLVDTSFLCKNGIETWVQSQPAFFDFDADGDEDLFVAAPSKYTNFELDKAYYKVNLYENIGDSQRAIFKLIDENFLDLKSLEMSFFSLSFGDLDNDGAVDMILGKEKGKIFFYKNMAKANEKAVFELKKWQFQNVKVSQKVYASIADVNYDGKNDLVLGDASGALKCYLFNNDSLVLYSEKWGNVQMGIAGLTNVYPIINDFDNNGKLDLLLTNSRGYVWFCKNFEFDKDFDIEKEVVYNDSLQIYKPFLRDKFICPAAANLNNDSIVDVVLGNTRGGLLYFDGKLLTPDHFSIRNLDPQISVYPNPVNDQVYIEIESIGKYDYKLYQLNGKTVAFGSFSKSENIEVSHLQNWVR